MDVRDGPKALAQEVPCSADRENEPQLQLQPSRHPPAGERGGVGLGISQSSRLNIEKRIDETASKTAQTSNWILRAISINRRPPYLQLFVSLVMPIIT